MMWLLIVASLSTGGLRSYEVADRATCARAVAMIQRAGGPAKAWCIPAYRLIAVSGGA